MKFILQSLIFQRTVDGAYRGLTVNIFIFTQRILKPKSSVSNLCFACARPSLFPQAAFRKLYVGVSYEFIIFCNIYYRKHLYHYFLSYIPISFLFLHNAPRTTRILRICYEESAESMKSGDKICRLVTLQFRHCFSAEKAMLNLKNDFRVLYGTQT